METTHSCDSSVGIASRKADSTSKPIRIIIEYDATPPLHDIQISMVNESA